MVRRVQAFQWPATSRPAGRLQAQQDARGPERKVMPILEDLNKKALPAEVLLEHGFSAPAEFA